MAVNGYTTVLVLGTLHAFGEYVTSQVVRTPGVPNVRLGYAKVTNGDQVTQWVHAKTRDDVIGLNRDTTTFVALEGADMEAWEICEHRYRRAVA